MAVRECEKIDFRRRVSGQISRFRDKTGDDLSHSRTVPVPLCPVSFWSRIASKILPVQSRSHDLGEVRPRQGSSPKRGAKYESENRGGKKSAKFTSESRHGFLSTRLWTSISNTDWDYNIFVWKTIIS